MRAALDLIDSLNHKTLTFDIASIKKSLPKERSYFDEADAVVKNCQKLTSNFDALSALYLAWQWDKVVIKSKHTGRQTLCN